MLKWLGLRSRLMLLVLAALAPVFALFTCSAAKNEQVVLALARDSLQSEALLAAAHQQRLVDRVEQLLEDIASGPSIKDTRNRLCEQYLKNLHAQDFGYSNLGVADLDGKVTCHAANMPNPVSLADRTFFIQALATRSFSVGDHAVSRTTGRPGMAFGMPVYGNDGLLNGVAFAAVDIQHFADTVAAEKIIEGGRLRVLDRHGVVLASTPPAGLVGATEPDPVVREAARARLAGVREAVDAAGLEQVYAYAPVSESHGGLFVAISVPRDLLTAAPRSLLLIDLAALLGMTALGMACAWVMARRLVVNPADALLREAQEIARGNFLARVRLAPSHQDEIGRLGQAFNQMAQSLQAQSDQREAALAEADAQRAMLDLILNSMSEGVMAIDAGGRFRLFNAAARKVFAPPGPQALFQDWREHNVLRTLEGQVIAADGPLSQSLRGVRIDNCDVLLRRPDSLDRILRVNARPLLDADSQALGALMVFTEVTALKAAEAFASAQEQVLVLIAGAAPLCESLEAVVRLIEKTSPQSLCCILMAEGGRLRHAVAPSLPPAFVQAIDGVPVGEGQGPCPTAAFRKEQVLVEDIAKVAHLPLTPRYRQLAAEHGLSACWSTPVLGSDGELLATFAIYRRAPGAPEPGDLALIACATRLARLALERIRAKAALVSSEARFRELAENIEDVFYSVDTPSRRLRYISPAYEKVWGQSCDSLYAAPASFSDPVLAEDRPVIQLISQRTGAGLGSDVEYRILAPDGQTRWIRDRSFPVLNAAGVPERVVGVARDITQSKRADLALAATYRALQMLSRSSIAINRIHDEAGLLDEVCRVAVELGGYRMAWVGYAMDDEEKTIRPMAHAGVELGYLQAVKLYWSEDCTGGRGPAGQAIRTGWPQQTGDIGRAGHRFHWREAAMERGYRSALMLPLCSEQQSFGVLCLYASHAQEFASEEIQLLQELADNLAFGVVSLRAQLERQRSEQAARQAQARLREQASLIDLAPDAIVVRNLDLTVRFWSKGAERLYGWPAQEVIGKTLLGVMYRDPQVLINAIGRIRAADGDWTGEVEQMAASGAPVHVQMRGTVVRDDNGQVNGVMIVNTDIRERNRAREEILRLNASLEERVEQRTVQLKFANQQLEAFSYSVSHDLRSPLSTIDGFSTLLEKSLTRPGGPPPGERSRHYLARIRAGARQMGELIDAMLMLAQVSRSSLVWEAVDISAKAEALLLALREREPGRLARLEVQPGLTDQGDPRLLQQVLYNLLGNAWKFTAGKDCTCISVGRLQDGDGGKVYFVRDNGAGFDMAYSAKLFGAFQRLHTEAEFAGTGIGLATVQRIIARHGGRVWAESVQGEGATFYFTLGAVAA